MYINKSFYFIFSIIYYNGPLSTIGGLKTDISSLHIFRLHLNTAKIFPQNQGISRKLCRNWKLNVNNYFKILLISSIPCFLFACLRVCFETSSHIPRLHWTFFIMENETRSHVTHATFNLISSKRWPWIADSPVFTCLVLELQVFSVGEGHLFYS